jgi:hypothetical protein
MDDNTDFYKSPEFILGRGITFLPARLNETYNTVSLPLKANSDKIEKYDEYGKLYIDIDREDNSEEKLKCSSGIKLSKKYNSSNTISMSKDNDKDKYNISLFFDYNSKEYKMFKFIEEEAIKHIKGLIKNKINVLTSLRKKYNYDEKKGLNHPQNQKALSKIDQELSKKKTPSLIMNNDIDTLKRDLEDRFLVRPLINPFTVGDDLRYYVYFDVGIDTPMMKFQNKEEKVNFDTVFYYFAGYNQLTGKRKYGEINNVKKNLVNGKFKGFYISRLFCVVNKLQNSTKPPYKYIFRKNIAKKIWIEKMILKNEKFEESEPINDIEEMIRLQQQQEEDLKNVEPNFNFGENQNTSQPDEDSEQQIQMNNRNIEVLENLEDTLGIIDDGDEDDEYIDPALSFDDKNFENKKKVTGKKRKRQDEATNSNDDSIKQPNKKIKK